MSYDDKAAVDQLHSVYGRLKEEIGQVIVGQESVIEQVLMAVFCRGHALLVGVPGLAKTLLVSTLAQALRPEFPPDPVHARPDARGHHRHRRAGSGPRNRPPRFPLRAGPGLRQHAARRRNQPHAAEDPGRLVRGDAGTPRHRRRAHDAPAGPVLRARHPEPDRTGRHLSAAGSPARPLPVQHRRRLPERERGTRNHPPGHQPVQRHHHAR